MTLETGLKGVDTHGVLNFVNDGRSNITEI